MRDLASLIQGNFVDPDLGDWIIPDCTTTTDDDKAVASIVMMATLKRHFSYQVEGGCGFPSVTLLGDKHDWQEVLDKIPKLNKFGEEPATFSHLLRRLFSA